MCGGREGGREGGRGSEWKKGIIIIINCKILHIIIISHHARLTSSCTSGGNGGRRGRCRVPRTDRERKKVVIVIHCTSV